METETSKTSSTLIGRSIFQTSQSFAFDLPFLIKSMKQSHSWMKGELTAMILFKSPHRQIILTATYEGTEIESFQANDSVTLQIVEGELMFNSPKEYLTLTKGQLITINEKVEYTLTSIKETVFLLTVLKGTLMMKENKIPGCPFNLINN